MRPTIFVTILIFVFFLPAVILGQNVIQVTAGDDQIDNALYQAQPGDILELITDGGIYNETFTTIIAVPVTIRAAAGLTNKPVWTCDRSGRLMTVSANLTLDGIIFDGSLGDSLTSDCIRTGDTEGLVLKVNNCVIRNFDDGDDGHGIKGKQEAKLDTLIVTNSRFEHMPGEHISYKDGTSDYPAGPVKYSRIEYCTFWDGGNEAIYIEDGDSDSGTGPHPVTIVNHVTCVGFGEKPIYPKETDGAVVRNSIVVNSGKLACTIYQTSVVENFLYYNTPGGINTKDNSAYDTDLVLEDQNPYFADAANGDFAVAGNSPAALFADDGTALGDTNNGTWDAAVISNWEIVENNNWGNLIKKAVTDGDTITFVTDGGNYYSPGSNSFPLMTLSFLAKPGLKKKPTFTTAYSTSYTIKIKGPATFRGLNFVGDGMLAHPDSTTDAGPYLVAFEDEQNDFGTTTFEDCEFSRCRLRAIHTDDKNTTDTLIVNNCIFKEIGETAVYGKEAVRNIDVAEITNCTFYKIGSNGIYLRDVGDLEVSHCTFVIADSSLTKRSGRGVYARDDTVVVIRDNIFAYIETKAVRVYGPSPTVEYNLFWENGENIVSEDDPSLTFPVFNLEEDPLFKDTTAANLDLALEVNNSPAVGMASDGTNLGDPRWGTWESTSVKDGEIAPKSFRLSQNYPNPFNPVTSICYTIPKNVKVTLSVFNLLGEKVATLVDQEQTAGDHSIQWNAMDDQGRKLASGVYFYKIQIDDLAVTKKMLILR